MSHLLAGWSPVVCAAPDSQYAAHLELATVGNLCLPVALQAGIRHDRLCVPQAAAASSGTCYMCSEFGLLLGFMVHSFGDRSELK